MSSDVQKMTDLVSDVHSLVAAVLDGLGLRRSPSHLHLRNGQIIEPSATFIDVGANIGSVRWSC